MPHKIHLNGIQLTPLIKQDKLYVRYRQNAVCDSCFFVIASSFLFFLTLGLQLAVGFAGLCSRAVRLTGRRLKAFEGVNTIF